jgi:hypothetical protein
MLGFLGIFAMDKNTWISVKDKLPNHQEILLARNIKGIGVTIFVDSKKMNIALRKNGYGIECVDIVKNPYYFISLEKLRPFKNVTTWMYLPDVFL